MYLNYTLNRFLYYYDEKKLYGIFIFKLENDYFWNRKL